MVISLPLRAADFSILCGGLPSITIRDLALSLLSCRPPSSRRGIGADCSPLPKSCPSWKDLLIEFVVDLPPPQHLGQEFAGHLEVFVGHRPLAIYSFGVEGSLPRLYGREVCGGFLGLRAWRIDHEQTHSRM